VEVKPCQIPYRGAELITAEHRGRREEGPDRGGELGGEFEHLPGGAQRNGLSRGMLMVWRRQVAGVVVGKRRELRADANLCGG
jgi:transposase